MHLTVEFVGIAGQVCDGESLVHAGAVVLDFWKQSDGFDTSPRLVINIQNVLD